MSFQSVEEEKSRARIGEAQIRADASRDVAQIGADASLSNAATAADASKYGSDNSLAASNYAADRGLQGALAPKTINKNYISSDSFIPDPDLESRAKGGPVKRSLPYLVGEKGPELMVPEKNGVIIPNRSLQALLAVASAFKVLQKAQKPITRLINQILGNLSSSSDHARK